MAIEHSQESLEEMKEFSEELEQLTDRTIGGILRA